MLRFDLGRHFLCLFAAISPAFAQLQDVEISTSRIKLEEQKSYNGAENVTTKQIAYKVTVANRTFRNLTDIDIKYMIFYDDAEPGSTEKPETKYIKGIEKIALIESHKVVTFETKPVKLTKSELGGSYYYFSGANNRARDMVSGLWFRAYADGKLLGEYTNPSTVAKRQQWKE